ATEFEQLWRQAVGRPHSVRKLNFNSELFSFGDEFAIQVHAATERDLKAGAQRLERALRALPGALDVQNDLDQAKREIQLRLTPEARSFGITLEQFADQTRAAFFGYEALRFQRGRDEIKVMVRLPEAERRSIDNLRNYRLRTADGAFIPLSEIAEIVETTSPTKIIRREGRRIVTLTARFDNVRTTANEALAHIRSTVLPDVQLAYPSVRLSESGQSREQKQLAQGLALNFVLGLFAIYALLALPFRSYRQPFIIMSAIPLGLVGAVAGHYMMGLELGLLSLFGLVGLSGIIINDALVLIDFANQEYRNGHSWQQALARAGKVRFRPIMLTSITTFLGVCPLILETSIQAQFLIPLAVSLGFGLLFGTVILMVFVPAVAMVIGPPPLAPDVSHSDITTASPERLLSPSSATQSNLLPSPTPNTKGD
ncbi:MAG: efflux RND transporter permease subunit, partial [Pseudomonadota bacterium]